MRVRVCVPALVALLVATSAADGQEVRPVAWWSFDQIVDGTVVDAVNGTRDTIDGHQATATGISGRALRFDGYTTRVVREAQAAPTVTAGVTVDGWVALGAYPWNWVPIVAHTDERGGGYFIGIGPRGELAWRLMVDGRWRTVESTDYAVPLRRWIHVAATYDRSEGLALYVDGREIGRLRIETDGYQGGRGLTGQVQPARAADLRIGMGLQRQQPSDWHRDKGTQPAWYSMDGLLDEVRIFDVALTPAQVARAHAEYPTPGEPELAPRVMPASPPGPGRFGAYYTRLEYYPEWDALWQMGPHPDVVVRFDRSPARLVFWRGTQYSPAWVTENNLWMADQSVEGYDRDLTWEHMNDKQNRYSHVRIIEQTDARVVVHWRYAPVNVLNELWNVDEKTGNGVWIDEYYYLYPDAMGVRQVTWRRDRMTTPVQFQESIPLAHPGQLQGDVIHPDYVTVGNLRGETQRFAYVENPPAQTTKPIPDDLTIQMHNLKSNQKPFIVFEPGNKMGYLRDLDIRALGRPGSSNHWPVGQIPSDGRTAQAADRASHFLGFPISSPPRHQGPDGRESWRALYGMTDRPFDTLVPLARSWARPPELRVRGEGFRTDGYDPAERAYKLRGTGSGGALEFDLIADAASPVRSVALVIENWGDADVTLMIDGTTVPRGPEFRYGLRHTLSGTDLVVWVEVQRDEPVTLTITEVK
jgi:hypothetical protein